MMSEARERKRGQVLTSLKSIEGSKTNQLSQDMTPIRNDLYSAIRGLLTESGSKP